MPKYKFELFGVKYVREADNLEQLEDYIQSLIVIQDNSDKEMNQESERISRLANSFKVEVL